MEFKFTVKVILLLLQVSIGVPANAFVLMIYAYAAYGEKDLKPIDKIMCHLVFANLLRLLPKGPPEIMHNLGLNNILDDAGCKSINYITRTARGVSICVTSLLSIYQAITLAPPTTRWQFLKSRSQKDIIPHIVGFWLFNMVLYISFAKQLFAVKNGTRPRFTYDLGFCYSKFIEPPFYYINMLLIIGHDVFFVGLMLLSSVYILYVLKRHREQVKYLHSARQNSKAMAERTAATNVIKLVSLYVFFYGVDTGFMVYTSGLSSVSSLLSEVRVFLSSCYAVLSPFLIISFNMKMYRKFRYPHKEKQMKSTDMNACHLKI
uniref:Vomeronasal type-1 receptor n=1 Tax=Geotrypetes seraphini TaxID=260995 RepID=A0A6P8NF98_GEOSA|nr:olfactory receptor class A-like protein 1 [Geotrypetes seraphini]